MVIIRHQIKLIIKSPTPQNTGQARADKWYALVCRGALPYCIILFYNSISKTKTAFGCSFWFLEDVSIWTLHCSFSFFEILAAPFINYVNSWWGYAFPLRMFIPLWFILTGNGMCLTWNAHPYREWLCHSPGMHILTGNGDVPHRECIFSPRMHIVYTGWATMPWRRCAMKFQKQYSEKLEENLPVKIAYCLSRSIQPTRCPPPPPPPPKKKMWTSLEKNSLVLKSGMAAGQVNQQIIMAFLS